MNTKTIKRRPFRSLERDLFFDLPCTCPNPRFEHGPIADLMTYTLMLTGYADDYFFDTVNREPREGNCRCGRRYRVQWFRDGVEAAWLDGEEAKGDG